jgi:hypothetical protein
MILIIGGILVVIGIIGIIIGIAKEDSDFLGSGAIIVAISIMVMFILLGILYPVDTKYAYDKTGIIEINKFSVVVITMNSNKIYTDSIVRYNVSESDSVFIKQDINSYGRVIDGCIKIKINGIYY